MRLDGITLALVLSEIKKQLIPAEIVAFHQIDQYGNMLVLKNNQDYHRLFFSLRPDRMAFFISELVPLPNNTNSMFSRQLNSLLRGGRLLAIKQVNLDRIIELDLEQYHKFGPTSKYKLIIEFMGKHSNAILIDAKGSIKAVFKQVGSDINRYREIKPGIFYKSPPEPNRLNPLTVSKEQFLSMAQKADASSQPEYLWQFFASRFQGIGANSAQEIIDFLNYPSKQILSELTANQLLLLWDGFRKLTEKIIEQDIFPVLLLDKESGKPLDYSLFCPKKQPGIDYLPFDRISLCLESFYTKINQEDKKLKLYQLIQKSLNKYQKKLLEKREYLEKRSKKIEKFEHYKKEGELLKANLWNIKRGMKQITLIDYSDPTHPALTIVLDPDLSPLQNVQQLFQRYKKLASDKKGVQKQLLENQKPLKQLQEFLIELGTARNSISRLTTLYEKLIELDIIKNKRERTIKGSGQRIPTPLKFISADDWTILVGKNNRQNEYILTNLSRGNDFWLHNESRSGAHVLIKNHQNLAAPPPATLNFAARLAGYYSKVKDGETAPIVYTFRKYVRKPKDVKVGKVVYSQEKSIPVRIAYEEIEKEIKKMTAR